MTLTVAQLIEQLQKMKQDAEVLFFDVNQDTRGVTACKIVEVDNAYMCELDWE